MYQILGVIVSVILLLVGILNDISTCIIAGIVFMFCNIGVIIGIRLKERRNKLLPILLMIAFLITIIILYYRFR